VLPRDTGDEPAKAAAAARATLDEGAGLVLGPLFAAATRAVGPLAAEAGATVLSFSNDAAAAGGNVYVLGFRPDEQAERVIRYAVAQGLDDVALLAPEDAYGAAVRAGFEAALAATGARGRSFTYRSAADLTSTVARLAGGEGAPPGPLDAVLVAEAGPALLRLAGLVQAAIAPPPRLLGTSRWLQAAGALGDPVLAGAWIAAVDPVARDAFGARFAAFFGREPHELAPLAYDATALAALLAGAGPETIGPVLTDPVGFAGSLAPFRLRADGTTEHGLPILEIGPDGTIAVRDPAPAGFAAAVTD
jgi:ABC-type branched-subunit amino acid transport system substrate-binding protein